MHFAIRADGGPEIGYGHLVRTGALAEEMFERGHVVTVATTTPQSVREVYRDAVDVVALPARDNPAPFVSWLDSMTPDAVFTDAYPVDTEYQRAVRERVPLAVLQDDARHAVCADLFVNGNLYAANLNYEFVGEEPIKCLGIEYLLLREPFQTLAAESHSFPSRVSNVLVTMGGVDKDNRTPTVLAGLDELGIKITAIIGPGFENEDEIRQIASHMNTAITILEDPDSLPALFLEADLSVCTLGTTAYEFLATQTPIIGIPDNQTPIDMALDTRDAAVVLPREPRPDDVNDAVSRVMSNIELRRSLWQAGSNLISGRGPANVLEAIEQLVRNQS